MHDDKDPDSCQTQNNNNQGDYLKISSRVTPPNGTPVELDSLMNTPPGRIRRSVVTLINVFCVGNAAKLCATVTAQSVVTGRLGVVLRNAEPFFE